MLTSPPSKRRVHAFVLANFVQACCWSVERLPQPGETLAAHDVSVEPGGKGLNIAIGLNRLGVPVQSLLGCGQDLAGNGLIKLFEEEGLSTAGVRRFAAASGWGSGWIAADGRNAIAVYPGANLLLTEQDTLSCREAIEAAAFVYGHFETSLPAVQSAFELACTAGVPTVLNPSPWQMPSLSLQRSTQTLLVNEVEAAHLLGFAKPLVLSDAPRVMAALPALWQAWPTLQRLVMTLGADGCWGIERSGSGHMRHAPAARIEAIDTVGAGDAFACGYLMACQDGLSFEQCLVWGNASGAWMASQRGVLGALPRKAQMEQMLQAHSVALAQVRMLR